MFKDVGRNAFWIIAIQAINFVMPLAALPHISRALGLNSFGLYTIAVVYGNYVLLFSDFSFNVNGPLRVAEAVQGRTLNNLTGNAFALKLLMLIPASCAYALAISRITGGSIDYIIAGIATAAAAALTPRWMMYGLGRLRQFALHSLATKLLWLASVYLLVSSPKDVILLLWLTAAAQFLLAGLGFRSVLKGGEGNLRFSRREILNIFTRDWRQFVALLGTSSLRDLAVVLLSFVVAPATLSLYGVADRVRFAILSVVAPVSQSLFLLTARSRSGLGKSLDQRTRGIANIAIVIAAFLAGVFVFFCAPWIIALVGGEKYVGAVGLLRILAFIPSFSAITSVMGINTLLSMGHQDEYANTQMLSVFIGGPLLAALTIFFGLYGAAWGALCAEATTASLLTLACARYHLLGRTFWIRELPARP